MNEKGNWNWFPGLIMIGVGVIFLLNYLTDFNIDNWWAYFILIPALGSFASAWNCYRRDGYLSSGARGSIFGGVMMTLVAAIFIFDLSWNIMWPIAVILIGIGILLGNGDRSAKEKSFD